MITNLKNHCKKDDGVKIEVVIKGIDQNQAQIVIKNPIADVGYSNSNGEGTKCLNLLASSEYFGFSYMAIIDGESYIQNLNFELEW